MGVPTAITRPVAVSRLRPSLGPIDCRRGGIIRTVVGLGKANIAVWCLDLDPGAFECAMALLRLIRESNLLTLPVEEARDLPQTP